LIRHRDRLPDVLDRQLVVHLDKVIQQLVKVGDLPISGFSRSLPCSSNLGSLLISANCGSPSL
jgi:hypothetical protein